MLRGDETTGSNDRRNMGVTLSYVLVFAELAGELTSQGIDSALTRQVSPAKLPTPFADDDQSSNNILL